MAAEKKAATPTLYRILKQDGPGWAEVQTVKASSASAAIRACVSKLAAADQGGVFVAVPTRSWTPVKVAPQTQIRLELTEVKP